MAGYILYPLGGIGSQLFDDDGKPLAGGEVYTYVADSLIPQDTWCDIEGVARRTNPIILDSAGRVPDSAMLYLLFDKPYKFVIQRRGTIYQTIDDINKQHQEAPLPQNADYVEGSAALAQGVAPEPVNADFAGAASIVFTYQAEQLQEGFSVLVTSKGMGNIPTAILQVTTDPPQLATVDIVLIPTLGYAGGMYVIERATGNVVGGILEFARISLPAPITGQPFRLMMSEGTYRIRVWSAVAPPANTRITAKIGGARP